MPALVMKKDTQPRMEYLRDQLKTLTRMRHKPQCHAKKDTGNRTMKFPMSIVITFLPFIVENRPLQTYTRPSMLSTLTTFIRRLPRIQGYSATHDGRRPTDTGARSWTRLFWSTCIRQQWSTTWKHTHYSIPLKLLQYDHDRTKTYWIRATPETTSHHYSRQLMNPKGQLVSA